MTETQQPPFDPLSSVAWPVRTARLLLLRAEPRDAAATWTFRQLPEFAQWQSGAPATFATYGAQFEQPESLARTLVVRLGGTVIGDLMISVEDAWAQDEVAEQARGVQANLGWGLHPAHNGHGYATEALGEVLRLCFGELQLRRVTADCFADNTASRRLMERVGMRREAYTVRDCLHRSGAWLDGTAYALLQQEWEVLRVNSHGFGRQPPDKWLFGLERGGGDAPVS